MNTSTHVLIVEDDESTRRYFSLRLKKAGFMTDEAQDVKSALQILETQEVQVVLTDVYLPDGNGIELVRMIKAAYPLIEIIATTSLGKIEDGVNAIKNGAYDYVEKGENDRLISLLTGAAEKVRVQTLLHLLNKEVEDSTHIKSQTDIIAQNLEQIEQAALIVKAIHSPIRQGIMHLIFTQGKANGKEIYTTLNLEQSIASQHLAILKDAGLVNAVREGKSVYYSANYTGIEKIIVFVQQLLGKN